MAGKDKRGKLFVAGIVGLGLVFLAVPVLTVIAIRAGISYKRIGPPQPTTADLTIPLERPAATGLAEDTPAPAPVRLSIHMGHGEYEIRPGPPGSHITVTGSYAANYYELIHERGDDGSIDIRLVHTAPLLVRIISHEVIHDSSPKTLVFTIPPDVPLSLSVAFSGGRSKSELGGLYLTDLMTHFESGHHRLGFEKPLAAELEQVSIIAERGELEVHGLGNALFRKLDVRTGMGDHEMDLSGEWTPGLEHEAVFRHSMGNLVLRIPEDIHVVSDSSNRGILGGIDGLRRGEETDDPDAPRLNVDLRSSMGGGIRISRH